MASIELLPCGCATNDVLHECDDSKSIWKSAEQAYQEKDMENYGRLVKLWLAHRHRLK